MQPGAIKVGTSGWKFDDWAGVFYPLRVPKTRWLEYYAARFPVGEINSTYYRIAPAASFAGIDRKTPDDFQIYAKLHGDVTHTRSDPATSMRTLHAALTPLKESGKLRGLLAQFPGGMHFTQPNLEYLREVRDLCGGLRLCVEFRNRSWMHDEAIEAIRDLGVTWVSVDEPELPDLMPSRLVCTSDLLYLRLHGRNARTWYDRAAGDRYDYLYAEDELERIAHGVLQARTQAADGVILFNNCHLGQAVRNGLWLKTWLETAQRAAAL